MAIHVGKYPQLADEAWLREQYETLGKSCPQIAAEVGCTPGAVEARCRTFEITMRGRHYEHWNPKECKRCGETYTPSGPAQRFCSQRCLRGARDCLYCGTEFLLSPANTLNLYCSRRCYWEHKKAEGTQGRYLSAGGYYRMNVPDGTPGRGRDGRMPEHRYVMQEALGRPLLDTETVHHINGDKTDNRLENLQLRQGRHGKGARFVCQDCGSHNVEAASI